MRSLETWLDEYSAAHQDSRNKSIHYYCVPAIAITTVALFWLVPIPGTSANAGQILLIAASYFYGYLSTRLALGMLPIILATAAGIMLYQLHIDIALWIPAASIWLIAWAMQFVGHQAEAKKPSFFDDILFLLIGPLWILAALYDKLGISYR